MLEAYISGIGSFASRLFVDRSFFSANQWPNTLNLLMENLLGLNLEIPVRWAFPQFLVSVYVQLNLVWLDFTFFPFKSRTCSDSCIFVVWVNNFNLIISACPRFKGQDLMRNRWLTKVIEKSCKDLEEEESLKSVTLDRCFVYGWWFLLHLSGLK